MAPENKASGVSSTPTTTDHVTVLLSRREQCALQLGAAILFRGQGRTPLALAREVVPFVDAFLAELDRTAGK